jgi:hypothetical protein
MDPYVQGQALAAGGALLGGLIGSKGPSLRKREHDLRRLLRAQYQTQLENEPALINAQVSSTVNSNWDAKMAAAERHGVHPLVAMGIAPVPGGGGTAGSVGAMHSQQQRDGSYIGRAAAAAGRAVAGKFTKLEQQRLQAEIDLIKAQAASLGQKPPQQPSGIPGQQVVTSAGNVKPAVDPAVQEIKKGESQTHKAKAPEQNLNEISPVSKFRLGTQTLLLPAEEADSVSEDPVAILGLGMMYHGNRKFDWQLAAEEWLLGPSMAKTPAVKARAAKIVAAARKRAAAARDKRILFTEKQNRRNRGKNWRYYLQRIR